MATIFINLSSSRCGNCNGNADPHAVSHEVTGFFMDKPGCGATYTHVSTDYMGMGSKEKDMRPDLIWIDPEDWLGGAHA